MDLQEQVALRLLPPPPKRDSTDSGENSWSQVPDDTDNALVAKDGATGIIQVIGPIALPTATVTGHDIEPDNQQAVIRLPEVEHDGMVHISSSLRDGGVEPAVAGFIQNAWKPSTGVQYSAIWRQ